VPTGAYPLASAERSPLIPQLAESRAVERPLLCVSRSHLRAEKPLRTRAVFCLQAQKQTDAWIARVEKVCALAFLGGVLARRRRRSAGYACPGYSLSPASAPGMLYLSVPVPIEGAFCLLQTETPACKMELHLIKALPDAGKEPVVLRKRAISDQNTSEKVRSFLAHRILGCSLLPNARSVSHGLRNCKAVGWRIRFPWQRGANAPQGNTHVQTDQREYSGRNEKLEQMSIASLMVFHV